jgi:hypothetical protein
VPGDSSYFTVSEARARMPEVKRIAAEIVDARADLVELRTALAHEEPSPLGGIAEAKALEARLDTLLSSLARDDIQVKGWAPLLVDFPARIDDHDVLLCWLEGEPELEWYHRVEYGFAGRRRLDPDAS